MNALIPNDSRVEQKFSNIGNGIKYHYMLAKPAGNPVATVVLLHGWPDLGMGWRFQVPYLVSLDLQVIIPDLLGYGQTSAPNPAEEYSMKKMSAHVAHIICEVTDQPIILGGHDWGAFLAWRLAMYYPELVRGVFTFCIPFFPPLPFVVTLEQLVDQMPAFKYQLKLASPVIETIATKTTAHLRGFLNAMYGGVTPKGLSGFDPMEGVIENGLEEIGPSPLVAPEMMDHYVTEYSRNGLHGPMNWYRTRSINGEDELPLAKEMATFKFQMPAMLVMAGQDLALPPSLADGQEQYFAVGLKKEVLPHASHWALIHCPDESNKYIGEFVKQVLG